MALMQRQRLDSHNTSVDEELAGLGRCGVIHLATGRRCTEPAWHPSHCTFVHVEQEPLPSRAGGDLVRGGKRGCVLGM